MSKKKLPIKIEIWLSIIALITGIISLFFSWQANQIARQQITSQIAILDVTDPDAPNNTEDDCEDDCVEVYYFAANINTDEEIYGHDSCIRRIRLANLGGAPTSLIGYKAEISFGNERNLLVSRKSTKIQGDNLFDSIINSFELIITNEDKNQEIPLKDIWVNMPIKIEAFETIDINAILEFDYSYYFPLEEILRIVYIFEFAPKQYLVSPLVNCAF